MASPKMPTYYPPQDAGPYFCERCRQIDFDQLFQREDCNVEILSFEPGQMLVHDQNCSFCRALDFIYPSLNKRPHAQRPCRLMLIRQREAHRGVHGLLQQPCPNGSFYISFLSITENVDDFMLWNRKSRYYSNDWDKVGYLAERQVIEQDRESLSSDFLPPSVDVEMIRRWIGDCEAEHSGECLAKSQKVEGVKFIDCISRTIVNQPDEETKYVALSYVWGLSNFSTGVVWSDNPMPLPEDLPTTIADALLVTERLGIQYLWVDRFCIEQEPPDSRKAIKDHQIVNMHNIYGSAYVTIIAAAGDGPEYGLPGISARLRCPFRMRISDRTLEATLADPKTLIDASKWSTRAWTYQEGLLSKRCLVFTDQQVCFQCSGMGIFEAAEMAQVEREPIRPSSNSPVSPHFQLNMGQGTRVSAWDAITYYSHLNLTKSDDILNGMLGILQKYQDIGDDHGAYGYSLFTPRMRHISGLPIEISTFTPTSWITGISHSLPWIAFGPGERRSQFPSWSWTGWTYKEFEDMRNTLSWPGVVFNPGIKVEMKSGVMFEGSELEGMLAMKHDFSKAKILHIKAPSLKAQLISRPLIFSPEDSLLLGESRYNVDNMVVNYEGAHGLYPLNLTDFSILSNRQPMIGIVLDKETMYRHWINDRSIATVLLIVQKDYCFERVGVSCIRRLDLEDVDTTVRYFPIG